MPTQRARGLMRASTPPPVLSMADVCAALGIRRETFYKHARAGTPAIVYLLSRSMRLGAGGRRRFDSADVERAKDMMRSMPERKS